jgi:hypothetical protein
MRRDRFGVVALLTCGAALASLALAEARVAAPPPLLQRVAIADCVLVGRVTAIEDKDVEAAEPGGGKTMLRVARVEVLQGLHEAKGLKSIRVGFPPPPPGGEGRPGRGGYGPPNLGSGKEYLLLLSRHAAEPTYRVMQAFDAVEKIDSAAFDGETKTVRRATQVLSGPKEALQAKNADDRLLAAALLIWRYRTGRPGAVKTEPIDAEESKLILKALREADWKKFLPELRTSALVLFQQLGLTAKDGWTPPKVVKNYQEEFTAAAQDWLKRNAPTYRIQRFVAAAK